MGYFWNIQIEKIRMFHFGEQNLRDFEHKQHNSINAIWREKISLRNNHDCSLILNPTKKTCFLH